METRIVVWDPSGAAPEGTIVEGPAIARAAASRIATLPVDPALFAEGRNGAAGYVRRAFGRGAPLHAAVAARRFCPIAIWAEADRHGLHWLARLAPLSSEHTAIAPGGVLRLAADTTQRGTIASGLGAEGGPVDLGALGPPDRWGGWTVGGSCRVTSGMDGLLGLSLYGTARGVAALWLAVSQSAGA